MKSLYLRIYLTVVIALALFAAGSAWLFQRQVQVERGRIDAQTSERIAAWAELIQRSLPSADAPRDVQAQALRDWSQRLRLPLALDDAAGERVAASDLYTRRLAELPGNPRGYPVRLDDGRTLWVLRAPPPVAQREGPREGPRAAQQRAAQRASPLPNAPPWLPGAGLAALLVLLFIAVAAGAYPVVRRLTRRLEALKQGVERFGAGALGQRVETGGRDEVAALASSFNRAAERIEALVAAHKNLLANASHELRSPLARMRMALSLMEESADATQRERLARELRANIGELDALVEEVLLASRLDAAQAAAFTPQPVDLVPLAAEEAARVGAELDSADSRLVIAGDERLLRRALRNLLENARRYGGDEVTVAARRDGAGAELRVCDRGPGVPEALRERIFEPFFRLPGHAEREGGVGLGLALVQQIAQRHGGRVRCEAREGGGSCFVLTLPAA
jgi:signal transduction histidine kinase